MGGRCFSSQIHEGKSNFPWKFNSNTTLLPQSLNWVCSKIVLANSSAVVRLQDLSLSIKCPLTADWWPSVLLISFFPWFHVISTLVTQVWRKKKELSYFKSASGSSKFCLTDSDDHKTVMTISVAAPPLQPGDWATRRRPFSPVEMKGPTSPAGRSQCSAGSPAHPGTVGRMDKWVETGWSGETGGVGGGRGRWRVSGASRALKCCESREIFLSDLKGKISTRYSLVFKSSRRFLKLSCV